MAISQTQRDYYRQAQLALSTGDFDNVLSTIWRVVSDNDISQKREELDERWKHIWNETVQNVSQSAPAEVIRRINDVMANIQLVDKGLWEVRLPEGDHITILLGAGASKPSPSNIPVVTEFLPELWRRARKLDRDDLNKLANWCDTYKISNIEDLLTAAQIANFSTKSRGVLTLLHYFLYARDTRGEDYRFVGGRVMPRQIPGPQPSDIAAVALLQDTLQLLFSLLAEPMISAKPNAGHKAIAELISKHPNTTLITTNYDGCIDESIKDLGIPYEYLIGQPDYDKNDAMAKLIKIHGSINWFYCDSCQEMDRYNLSDIKEAYEKDKMSYPVIGICKHCGGLSRPMIVPPLSLKFLMFPPLAGLWDRAQIAFQKAKTILVVGYSFSEADTYITKMISRAMGADKNKKLIIIDVDTSLANNVSKKFATHIDNFDIKRVIRAVENCDILLPQLCNSLIGKGTIATGPSRKIAAKNKVKPPTKT